METAGNNSELPGETLRPIVLQATIEVLVRNGIAGATVRRIAAEAGVSAGAVQHHFPSRAQLLRETLDQIFLSLGKQLADFQFSCAVDTRAREVVEVLWAFYSGQNYLAAQEILLGSRKGVNNEELLQRVSYAEMDQLFRHAWHRIVEGTALDVEAGYPLLRLLLSSMRGMAVIAVHRRRADFIDDQMVILGGLLGDALKFGDVPYLTTPVGPLEKELMRTPRDVTASEEAAMMEDKN